MKQNSEKNFLQLKKLQAELKEKEEAMECQR